jgi:8-oxo-dGTP diphosphatase
MITLAGCLILDEKGRLLLIHRHTPTRTQWELPGGKVDAGEDPRTAAIRELREELGIEVDLVRELGHQTFTEDGHTIHYTWFLAIILAGTPTLTEPKYDQLRYFSWNELKTRTDLSPNTRNLVAAQLHGVELSSRSKERRMRNERLIRQGNQQVKAMAERILDSAAKTLLPLAFTCECSNAKCQDTIELSADDYTVAHQYPDQFVIKPGHEQLDIERVVSSHPDVSHPEYCIVEKYLIGLSVNPTPSS